MLRLIGAMITVSLLLAGCGSGKRSGNPRVLVFSKTAGFRHSSIPNGIAAIQKLGRENNFDVDTTENAGWFTEDSLKKYAAVIFLNSTGDVLNHYQQAEFERYIQAGGGYVGIHAATDCEYQWPWYGKLVGAYFKSHPKIQKAKFVVKDKTHASTSFLPDVWERTDELYNFKKVPSDSDVHVLLTIDEKSYEGGENGDNHPMAWYHDYDGGRAFYTELGHTEESYTEENYLKHILGGIQYAMGKNEELNYSKATSQIAPDEDRFTKVQLATGFDEPTEMAILPNLDILVVQRKGEILYYDQSVKKLSDAAKLDVYYKATVSGVNAEEGLLGICADPDYAKNNYVYLFYSPKDTSVNRLSRFVFKDKKFDLSSEKIILQFYSQRNICCHTGGSIAFGPDRTLFLSTGDNSTPFDQPKSKYTLKGYGPIDERPGFEQFDARRSSANSNDLRGKIIRIKIKEDGTYEIPDGNLFKPGTPDTRPEIYVMGNRNPYRISVDRKTGFLYWGEVGPDAANDSLETRGPRGYDELNQARKAGFFGWPLFVGNNYAYRDFDYVTGKSGPPFDASKPVNDSRNNTGVKELPAVSPAFIYYPYAISNEFPELGTGGRNAMAGPVYYAEYYPKETRMPEYYNGKLLFYEWMRGWMKMVTMDAGGNYIKMEPFMEHTKLNAAIDIEMGPDGRLYILEYGNGWFTKNPDAMLSRVDYNSGNRAPKVKLAVDKTSGALPFTVKLSAEGSSDPDKDPITYTWHYGSGQKQTKEPVTDITLNNAGNYEIYVEAADDKGAISKSEVLQVYAGNEAPVVSVELPDKPSFFFPGKPVAYKVSVNDKEDGNSADGKIDMNNVFVKVDYMAGMDRAQIMGHQQFASLAEGKNLVTSLDCKTCHKENEKSIGPAYKAVADKYRNDPKATDYLMDKIIKGGGGVWGETAMAAHPDLKKEDAQKIVSWIMSLAATTGKSLPAEGKITADARNAADNKTMLITAIYADKGGNNIKPLTGTGSISLRNATLSPADKDTADGINVMEFSNTKFAILNGNQGWVAFHDINMKYITSVELKYGIQTPLGKGYIVELRMDKPDGQKLGEVLISSGAKPGFENKTSIRVGSPADGVHHIYFVIRKADASENNPMAISAFRFIAQ
jgi:cytochrome c